MHREIIEEQVLRIVVDRNVKARRIGKVENVEAELESEPLGKLRKLDHRQVGALLPRLPENVALTRGEIGFERVARGNGAAKITRVEERQGETIRFQRRCARSCTVCSLPPLIWPPPSR